MTHDTSSYMQPAEGQLITRAEFQDFAPADCVCCGCLVPDAQKARTFARVYENKIEVNYPIAPFCCLTSELCIHDNIFTGYFDKPPARAGLCCGCCPFTCCGPPVIFAHRPKCF